MRFTSAFIPWDLGSRLISDFFYIGYEFPVRSHPVILYNIIADDTKHSCISLTSFQFWKQVVYAEAAEWRTDTKCCGSVIFARMFPVDTRHQISLGCVSPCLFHNCLPRYLFFSFQFTSFINFFLFFFCVHHTFRPTRWSNFFIQTKETINLNSIQTIFNLLFRLSLFVRLDRS